jgi:micrococcal nuclease
VEYVHDGDTLFLEDGRKVRLLGIDAPEVGDDAECFGTEATALLRSLLPEGARVRVLADVEPLDQYGRSLLFVYTDDGTLVNLELLELGAAEAVVLEPNVLFAQSLEAAEDSARSTGVGMWAACH